MKNSCVNFYLSPFLKPEEYGFVDRGEEWCYRYGHQGSCVAIDKVTRRIRCNGVSSKCLAVLFRIAAKGGIEIEEDGEGRQYRMNLTAEEVKAIEAMRGHPAEDKS